MTAGALSRRGAAAASIVAGGALAVGTGSWLVAAAVVTAALTAIGIERFTHDRLLHSTTGCSLATVAISAGVGVPVAAFMGLAVPPWQVALALTVWAGSVTVFVVDGPEPDVLSTLAGSVGLASVLVGAAVFLFSGVLSAGIGSVTWTALSIALTVPAGQLHAGVFLMLVTALGALTWIALQVVPTVTLLSPRATESMLERLDEVEDWLLKGTVVVGCLIVLGFWVSGSGIPVGGIVGLPLLVVGGVLRGVLLFGIGLATIVICIGLGVRFAWAIDPERVRTVAAVGGGATVTTLVAVGGASGLAATTAVEAVSLLKVLALAGATTTAALLGLVLATITLPNNRSVVGAVAFVLSGVVVALETTAIVAPIVAVAAGLVIWDALRYRSQLRSDLSSIVTTDVERRHLGGTLAVGVGTSVLAIGVAGGTQVVSGLITGRPLVVVVATATVLLVTTGALLLRDQP